MVFIHAIWVGHLFCAGHSQDDGVAIPAMDEVAVVKC